MDRFQADVIHVVNVTDGENGCLYDPGQADGLLMGARRRLEHRERHQQMRVARPAVKQGAGDGVPPLRHCVVVTSKFWRALWRRLLLREGIPEQQPWLPAERSDQHLQAGEKEKDPDGKQNQSHGKAVGIST